MSKLVVGLGLLAALGCRVLPPSLSGSARAPAAGAGWDPAALDRSVDPCTDFYQFACGGWAARTEIPPDRPGWSRSFSEIGERNLAQLRGILEAYAAGKFAPGDSEARKLGDFYATCMDEEKAETTSEETAHDALRRIDGTASRVGLARELAWLHLAGVDSLFAFGAEPDLMDATRVIGRADQGGLGLPERDYYLKADPKSVRIRALYVDHVAKILVLAGAAEDAAAQQARTVLRIETVLARASLRVVDRRDPYHVYHRIDREGLERAAPAFAWNTYFDALGHPDVSIINVAAPRFFVGLNALLRKVRTDDLRTYLRWHLLHRSAPALGKRFVDEDFRFAAALTGAQQLLPRWKRCVSATDALLGEALGKPFVREVFGPDDRARAKAMIEAVEHAFETNLGALSWLDGETRGRAVAKLRKVVNKVGFPDRWRSYEALEIDRRSHLANLMRAVAFEAQRQLNKIGGPVDRSEWQTTPATVNAYYNPSLNEIVFPAGILQAPFFTPTAAAAVNYGAIGMVMGHEFTHGFDDQGRKFDGEGNLHEWWTPAVRETFAQRADCLRQQYDGYVVVDDRHVNGRLTLGENIADQGGLKLAFNAYRGTPAEATLAAPAGGFTPDQQFFLSFGQAWCTKRRPDYERMLANVDPHSPPRYRVNGALSNLPAFAAAFSCPAGSPMAPAARCEVW